MPLTSNAHKPLKQKIDFVHGGEMKALKEEIENNKVKKSTKDSFMKQGVAPSKRDFRQADGRVATPAACQHGFDSSPPFSKSSPSRPLLHQTDTCYWIYRNNLRRRQNASGWTESNKDEKETREFDHAIDCQVTAAQGGFCCRHHHRFSCDLVQRCEGFVSPP
ncbi:hypothetical protein O3P69_017909 [Scylla paramamosain]|uniref:Uncharacterized protein n=1 Tax=Scylla paramamosain TaxID=85552 RepID=A0AAW0TGM6_SCYPA